MYDQISSYVGFYHAAVRPADAKLTLPCHGQHASIRPMPSTTGFIQAHAISPAGKPALRLRVEPGSRPSPGQPFLAYLNESTAPIRTALYPSRLHRDGFTTIDIPSPAWTIGAQVQLMGPIGRGFSPPTKSKRRLVIALGQPIDRLIPLIDAAVKSDISIAAFTDGQFPNLPAQVEIATDPADVKGWADYIAVDTHALRIAEVADFIAPQPGIPPAADVEMLLDAALACGFGVCAACAVNTGSGWRLACQDGPVFNMRGWSW